MTKVLRECLKYEVMLYFLLIEGKGKGHPTTGRGDPRGSG